MTSRKTNVPAWVSGAKPDSRALLRLFCFPYAGGGASIYRAWPSAFPGSVEVCPVQFPGRETRLRERPFTRLAPLISATGVALRPYFNMPFAFFGHSMGALVAFELVRALRQEGAKGPNHL